MEGCSIGNLVKSRLATPEKFPTSQDVPSPHQHGNLTGGFFTAPLLLLILAVEPALVAEEVVDGGIAVAWRWASLRSAEMLARVQGRVQE